MVSPIADVARLFWGVGAVELGDPADVAGGASGVDASPQGSPRRPVAFDHGAREGIPSGPHRDGMASKCALVASESDEARRPHAMGGQGSGSAHSVPVRFGVSVESGG